MVVYSIFVWLPFISVNYLFPDSRMTRGVIWIVLKFLIFSKLIICRNITKSHFHRLVVKISYCILSSYTKPNTVLCLNTGRTYKSLGDGFKCQSYFDGLSFSGVAWILKLLRSQQRPACGVLGDLAVHFKRPAYGLTTVKASRQWMKSLWRAVCICRN